MKRTLSLVVLSVAVLAQGCGKDDAVSTKSAFLQSAASETVPKISSVLLLQVQQMAQLMGVEEWTDGKLGYNIYNLLREPVSGQTDNSNLYMNMKMADDAYVTLGDQTTALDSTKTIASPFNFGTGYDISGLTFDKGKNGLPGSMGNASIAYREEGDNRYLLFSMYPSASYTAADNYLKGVTQVSYNATTGAITLNQVLYLRYGTGSTMGAGSVYANRMWIDGNTKTHSFKVKSIQSGGAENTFSYKYSLVGHGISQGTSNSFLIYIKNRDTDSLQGKYVCIGAGKTGNEFKTFFDGLNAYATASSDGSLSNCESYKAYVDGVANGTDPANGGLFTDADLAQSDNDARFVGAGTSHMELSL